MTTVRIQVVELEPTARGAREQIVLQIDVQQFTQGVEAGETAAAITWAQRLVRQAARLWPDLGARDAGPRCGDELSPGVACTAAQHHIGPHRNGPRAWGG